MNKTADARHSHGDHAVAETPNDSVVSPALTHEAYKVELRLLQIQLVKPDFNIAFEFTLDCIDSKRLAR